jgi:Tfp pilus assembly protein PilZ
LAADTRTLRIEFSTEESFESEYATNIANGGIFIGTRSEYEVRDAVVVEIALGYSGKRISLDGEVVHRVPPELAETGAIPGVAVQFSKSARELRDAFEKLTGVGSAVDERAIGSGRRVAPRTTARVSAKLESGSQVLDGRTRNLSSSGVLVNIECEPLALGQPAQVVLTHPTTGERMAIPSRVARHLRGTCGAVTAIGLAFEPPEATRAELDRFVSEVKAAEHSRRLGGISGAISELGIENILQMFGKCSPRGTLMLTNGPEEGEVVFEAGLLRRVQAGGQSGHEALAELLAWREGTFEFQARIEGEGFEEAPLPLEAAILAALREADERGHARAGDLVVPGGAVLRVVRDEVDAASGDFDKTESAVLDLAGVGMKVDKILAIIPEAESDVRSAIDALLRRGLLILD